MYKIFIEKHALKQLKRIEKQDCLSITKAISELSKNPHPLGHKKLINRDGYRIRVGNYRVIYEIFDKILVVNVLLIGHRKEIYR